jgi:hypothetical protein
MSENNSPVPESPAPPTPAEEEKKPEPTYIQVKVKDQQENEVFFKIKPSTQMKKVFDAYCKTKSISRDSVRFLFEGERVQDLDTPEKLEMDDDNMIEVFSEQQGGCF